MRGMYTTGILDVMMEQGITFDGAIGVSAGACFGCNLKSHQIGRGIRYNRRFCKDPRYASFRSLFKTGDLFGADFCYHDIPFELDPFDTETYAADPMEFYVVATDVETGRPVYHRCDNGDEKDLQWFRASASMPLVSRIVEIDGRKYLDGGISDSIPLAFFQKLGYEKNVVILTQPASYRKKKNELLPAITMALRDYPEVLKTIAMRHQKYNRTLEYIAKEERLGHVFVFRPKEKLGIGHVEHDEEELERVYQIGRAAGEEQMVSLKAFLEG